MRFTIFARKAAEAATHAAEAAALQRRVTELLTPPKGPSAKAWYKMRAELDSPEHRAWIKEVLSSPTLETDQKKLAERLGVILEEAAKSNSYY